MRLHATAAAIAEHQLGLVTRTQLLRRRAGPDAIGAAVRRRRLLPAARGVYRLPGAPDTPESRLLARTLACGPGALLSHQTAAWLWGLSAPPPDHHVSVPRGRRPRRVGLVVHESSDLRLATPGVVRGLPVTGVGRTILDCATDPACDVELLVDAARRIHGTSRRLLPATVLIHARHGRHGIGRLRELVADDELPHSDFERLVCRWLVDEGISGWELHRRLVLPRFGPVEPDITWAHERVVLELEGADHRDRQAVHDHDTARQNALLLAGYAVLRLTWRRWVRETATFRQELVTTLAGDHGREPATAAVHRAPPRSPVPWPLDPAS